jgi:hypothetical protein
MPKRGQHKNDAHDKSKSKGPNNPAKSVTITTGTYKKAETYAKQAAEGRDPHKQAQAATNEWNPDTRDQVTIEGSPRARKGDLSLKHERKKYGPTAKREQRSGFYDSQGQSS